MLFGSRIGSLVRLIVLASAVVAASILATGAWSQSSSSSEAVSSSEVSSSAASPIPLPDTDSALPMGWSSIASSIVSIVLFGFVVAGGFWALRWFMAERKHEVPTYKPEEIKVFNSTRVVARATAAFAIAGLMIVAALCLGFAKGNAWTFLAYLGTDILVAAAAAAAGAVAGFVFGIPRTRDALDRASADTTGGQKSKAVLLANTNLERVSDWLTTLLIGATLVQLRDLPHWLVAVGRTLNDGFKNENVIPFVLVFFFGLAFLGIYLVTRLYLTVTFWQTLDMVGGAGGGPDLVAARKKLENALAATDVEQLETIQYVDAAGIKPDQTGDFGFSLALARTLLKLLATNKSDDAGRRKQDLKSVVGVIAGDPATAATLKDDLANARYTSGDGALDTELTTVLGG